MTTNISTGKLSIDLNAQLNYSFTNKKSNERLDKSEIDSHIKSFSNLNRETGNPICRGREVSGMIGENLFRWLRSWPEAPTKDRIREEFTKRVIGFVQDLQQENAFKNTVVNFSGSNAQFLDIS